MIQMGTLSDVRIRDARTEELDEPARLLAAVYGAFRTHLPADAWKRYIGEIVAVRSRLGESELIVAGHAGGLIGPPGLYERLGFRRAPEFDIEIGEMFTGRSLPRADSWQARAYRLDPQET